MASKSKYVWVIAGGIMQIPLMEEIKSRGLKIFCTDGDKNCPGAGIADQFVQLDTYDVYGHLDLAASMSDKPIAVLTAGADVESMKQRALSSRTGLNRDTASFPMKILTVSA